MAADGVRGVGRRGKGIEDRGVQMVGVGAVGFRMHHALGNGDRAGTAASAQLVKRGGFRADAAVVFNVRAVHGRGEHTVFEGHVPNRDGRT